MYEFFMQLQLLCKGKAINTTTDQSAAAQDNTCLRGLVDWIH